MPRQYPSARQKKFMGRVEVRGTMQSNCAASAASMTESWSAVQATADDVLIRRIAVGDKRAMQALFARHNVRIYRFVARLIGPSAIAEDLVSEVFLDVWRKAAQFEGRSQVSTWLLAIARFKALSQLRNRVVDYLDDDTALAIEDPCDDPEVSCEKRDTGALLRRCLAFLTPAHREVIDLVYYHERSMEEVADILQIPEATVRTRMFYARKRLADLLKAEGVEHAWA
jgi:RNA polymerase sigma-70 factor, ECF subfamily